MQALETKLGYTFRRPALLENALYHSSYANEHRAGGITSNERLEFLGDAVLGFVTAEYLYAKHPDLPEGDLMVRIRELFPKQPLTAMHLLALIGANGIGRLGYAIPSVPPTPAPPDGVALDDRLTRSLRACLEEGVGARPAVA